MKKCKQCNKEKELSEFAKDKYTLDGLTHQCKLCRNTVAVNYYKENPHKQKEKNISQKDNRKRYYSSEEGVKSSRRAHLKRMFNMTLEEYNQKLEDQGGKCEICNSFNTYDKHGVLAVDHCHKSRKIRGLLCFKCNTVLGSVNDDTEILNNAIKYLEKYGF